MFNISEKRYAKKLNRIKKKNENIKYKQILNKEKYKYKSKPKLPSTSKMIVFYLFVLLNVIIIYSMISMWKFKDLSYLNVLITDIAAQIIVFMTYAVKSIKENTKNGIVFETAMLQKQDENIDNDLSEMDNEETEN